MAATIILDAGHGGWHNGAAYEGRLEKDDALALTLAVGRILEDNGINVLYTRTTDSYRSPAERAEAANQTNADYFVSIHRTASPTPGAIFRCGNAGLRKRRRGRAACRSH